MSNNRKILLLGDVNSIHLQKWILALKDHFGVLVFSIDKLHVSNKWMEELDGVKLFTSEENSSNSKSVLSYLKHKKKLKKIYKAYQPDITHAHYATSYGLLGALCNPKNYCISAWGTDVLLFPKKSFLHRIVFKNILKRAHYLFATSKNLTLELQKYTTKAVTTIPFGIDTQLFSPDTGYKSNTSFTIGTVKGLNKIYGIDRLIDAFATFNKKYPDSQCLIYGKGKDQALFEKQISELGLIDRVVLKGFVENKHVPAVLNSFDVYCALSRSESFGVAIIEASACEIPVVVSNVGGLSEVVKHKETGFIVDGDSEQEIVNCLEQLYHDKALRETMGRNGRSFVTEEYEWNKNVKQQVDFYNQLLVVSDK